MEADSSDRGEVRVLSIQGHVSASDIHVLVAKLGDMKETPSTRVVLDMTLLKNLPTAVMGALVDLIRSLENVGGRLALAAPGTGVRISLERLGIAPMVAMTESLDEAVNMLRDE